MIRTMLTSPWIGLGLTFLCLGVGGGCRVDNQCKPPLPSALVVDRLPHGPTICDPCYGYHPTCWRAWSECCNQCPPPEQMTPVSQGQLKENIPVPQAVPMPEKELDIVPVPSEDPQSKSQDVPVIDAPLSPMDEKPKKEKPQSEKSRDNAEDSDQTRVSLPPLDDKPMTAEPRHIINPPLKTDSLPPLENKPKEDIPKTEEPRLIDNLPSTDALSPSEPKPLPKTPQAKENKSPKTEKTPNTQDLPKIIPPSSLENQPKPKMDAPRTVMPILASNEKGEPSCIRPVGNLGWHSRGSGRAAPQAIIKNNVPAPQKSNQPDDDAAQEEAPMPDRYSQNETDSDKDVAIRPIPGYGLGNLNADSGGAEFAPQPDMFLAVLVPEERKIFPEIRQIVFWQENKGRDDAQQDQ